MNPVEEMSGHFRNTLYYVMGLSYVINYTRLGVKAPGALH